MIALEREEGRKKRVQYCTVLYTTGEEQGTRRKEKEAKEGKGRKE